MNIVGIDLGTTNSLVAVMRDDGPETLTNELGDHLTPSAVAFADDGSLLVGRAAKDRLVVAPDAGRAFFKRDMGTPTTYRFGGRGVTPTECSAHVLREMKRIAELRLGEPVTHAVVTVPAYFHDPQRQATIEAARLAGLHVDRILNEPTAAALAYGQRHAKEERRLVVFDLGGGTFDVTVLEVFEGVIEVRASGGDSRLGGEDYTDALLSQAIALAGLEPSPGAAGRWRQRIEVAKRALATADRVEVDLDGRRVELTRAAFEQATRSLTARLAPIVRRCLSDAGLSRSDVDDVLLVGGATRMPGAQALAAEEFGRIPNRSLDPDRVVALGAAVQGARAARHEAVKDLVMTDVCPHSLGVEVTKTYGRLQVAGHYLPILDRNIVVPVSRMERLNTLHPDQDMLELRIYQGESRRVTENTLLGTLKVAGLRERPGQRHPGEVDVRFTYDANGILEVEVTVVETLKRLTKVIERRPGRSTPKQREAALNALKAIKVRPRDLLPNRARLERANRLYQEWSGERRHRLSAMIDEFERALETGLPDQIGLATAILDRVLEDAYEDEGERQADDPDDGRFSGDGGPSPDGGDDGSDPDASDPDDADRDDADPSHGDDGDAGLDEDRDGPEPQPRDRP